MRILEEYIPYEPILANCPIFAGIPMQDYGEVIRFLGASLMVYEKGEAIYRLGEPLDRSGIVLSGSVEGSFLSENYNKIGMNQFKAGESFAEALACADTRNSPIQVEALSDAAVLLLDLRRIMSEQECECRHQHQLSVNLIHILARQNVFSNLKLRIASQRALRDKVLIYLHSLPADDNGWSEAPFSQTALAEFLGVNRSALSRELGRMQDEELLQVDGHRMKLLRNYF